MKKLLFMLAAIVLISTLIISACSSTSTVTTTVTKQAVTQTATATETATATKTATATTTATETVKPITLVFSTHDPPVAPLVTDLCMPYFAEVDSRSGGRVKVEAHFAGELATQPETFDFVAKGTLDAGFIMPMSLAGRFPLDDIVTFMPYDTWCHRPSRVYWELHEKFPEMDTPFVNTKILWLGTFSPTYLGSAKNPVRTLEDCQGLRAAGLSKLFSDRMEALGMTPVDISPPDLYMALDTGMIDVLTVNTSNLLGFGLGPVVNYVTLVPSTPPNMAIVLNLDTWKRLPADIQKIMEETGREFVDRWDEVYAQTEKEEWPRLAQEFGIEFVELLPGETAKWVEADAPVKEAFVANIEAKGLPGKEVMEEFLRLFKKYSAEEYAFE